MNPVISAINIAVIMKNNALIPKKLKSSIVTGRFAHGDASKNVITAGMLAPFLYNCMAIASIPCEQAESKNPPMTA